MIGKGFVVKEDVKIFGFFNLSPFGKFFSAPLTFFKLVRVLKIGKGVANGEGFFFDVGLVKGV